MRISTQYLLLISYWKLKKFEMIKIFQKDILELQDFVKIVRNETADKQKIRETSQKPDYYTYDLYEAISNKAFELCIMKAVNI